jgi:hypothetical protein
MRAIKLGAAAALLVVATLALLWITEAVPRADIAEMAPKALGALVVLIVAGVALAALSGKTSAPDNTDKPVP